MEIVNQIVMKKISEVKPYVRNPRKNDKTVNLLVEIIPKVGFNVPLVIDRNSIIVKGHARYAAAIRLGMEEIPCVVTDADEETIKLDRLADNRISEFSEWINDELLHEIDMLNLDFDFDLESLGFPAPSDDFDADALFDDGVVGESEEDRRARYQAYLDKTEGEKLYVQFYDTTSDHAYTVSTKWNATDEKGAAFFSDVKNMCRKLSKRGLRAADLVIGSDVADAILALTDVKSLLDRNSGIIIGTIDQQLSPYDGVTYMGTLNFGGFRLNVICVDETYVDDSGTEQRYFPATSAMVTAPDCGHMMYGQITQIDYGSTDFSTYVAKRVPKFVLDQPNDRRKLRLAARPLAAPKNYCPYIYAANVVA